MNVGAVAGTSLDVGAVMQALTSTGGKLDFSPLDRRVPQIFVDAVHKQIDSQFQALYIALGIKLLMVALLIALEMWVYFKYHLPRLWSDWKHWRRPEALAGMSKAASRTAYGELQGGFADPDRCHYFGVRQ